MCSFCHIVYLKSSWVKVCFYVTTLMLLGKIASIFQATKASHTKQLQEIVEADRDVRSKFLHILGWETFAKSPGKGAVFRDNACTSFRNTHWGRLACSWHRRIFQNKEQNQKGSGNSKPLLNRKYWGLCLIFYSIFCSLLNIFFLFVALVFTLP